MFEGQTLAISVGVSVGVAFAISFCVYTLMLSISIFLIEGAKGYLISVWVFIALLVLTGVLSLINFNVNKIIKDSIWMLTLYFAGDATLNIRFYRQALKKELREFKKGIQN